MSGRPGTRSARRPAAARSEAAAEDAGEAVRLVERQRRDAARARGEAEERRRRAAAHAGGPRDPRAQGLWDAAAFHAERARLAEAQLAAMERQAETIRARAAVARQAAAEEGRVRPCG